LATAASPFARVRNITRPMFYQALVGAVSTFVILIKAMKKI
jgi:hypothetical protein